MKLLGEQYPAFVKLRNQVSALEKSILLGLVATVLVVTPYSAMDPMNLPKMTIVAIISFLTLGFLIASREKILIGQHGVALVLTLTFQLLLLLNLLLSGRNVTENFYGTSGRNTGVLTYLALSILMFSVITVSAPHFVDVFRATLFSLGIVLFLYGCIQFVGLEPFPYVNVYASNVFGTFGNPNFQSAFMGILGASAVVTIFDLTLSRQFRILSIGISIASVFGIYSTNSWQGYFTLVAGIAAGIILLLLKHKCFKVGLLALSGALVSAVIVAMGIFSKGPLAAIISKASLEARKLYWDSAIHIISSNPLFGVGFDGFGDWYRRGRSQEAALNSPGLISTSAHNVPLDIGVGGGLPILILYFGFVILALRKIVQIIKSDSLSVSYISICAAWVAYQAQSLISINQIGLGVIGWVLLGVVIGYQPSMETSSKQRITKSSRLSSNSFGSFAAPYAGLAIGLMVALPPYVAANNFYDSLKSSDIKLVQAAALRGPQDSQRILAAAQVLENNKYFNESLMMVQLVNQKFPDSFEAWRYLSTLTNATASDKQEAKNQMRRLDPFFDE
jgi:O-antigen ligase